jgi:hypothetical protein
MKKLTNEDEGGGTGRFSYQMEKWEGHLRYCVIDSLSIVSEKHFKADKTFRP